MGVKDMKITVNGKNVEIRQEQITVLDILNSENISDIETIAVQLNGEFLDKQLYKSTVVSEDDSIDYLFFVGGGGR